MRAAAASARTERAGQVAGRLRRNRETAWLDSIPTRGKTHRSVGTPRRRAASTEHSTMAAAWLTVDWDECHLLYGNDRGRFSGEGLARNTASHGAGKAAPGLTVAHR